jgi:2-polyprenyl-3-methyl-5-hydroxy-6-metoxy-1,4-benzoquinol methylase
MPTGEQADNEGIRATPKPNCDLCGATGSQLHGDLSDRDYGAPGRWAVMHCGSCGFCWIDPRPRDEEIGRLYAAYHTHERVERGSLFVRAVRVALSSRLLGYRDARLSRAESGFALLIGWIGPLRELARHASLWLPAARRGELLDVGCGAGAFLVQMRELGWSVRGLDTDPGAVATAREQLGDVSVTQAAIEDLEPATAQFDAITLSHVIEHLPDPARSLAHCVRLLRPGGWIVIATPNSRSLGARHFGRDWRGWEPPRHLQVFDGHTLAKLAERAGLHVLRSFTVSASAYFIWLASSRSQSLRVRLSGLVFWARAYALTLLGRDCGEEVVVIAERPGDLGR